MMKTMEEGIYLIDNKYQNVAKEFSKTKNFNEDV